MNDLKILWNDTKTACDELEQALVDRYIGFLREVAREYLRQGRRVFFSENRFVHWGEANFGWLTIQGSEETSDVFGDYISEIRFETELTEKNLRGAVEITDENIEAIRYGA